jgi:hypothetical protein
VRSVLGSASGGYIALQRSCYLILEFGAQGNSSLGSTCSMEFGHSGSQGWASWTNRDVAGNGWISIYNQSPEAADETFTYTRPQRPINRPIGIGRPVIITTPPLNGGSFNEP